MTNDQIIHEASGRCCHINRKPNGILYKCQDCGEKGLGRDIVVPDYSKWEHYGPMLEWAMKQRWWRRVAYNVDINDFEGTAEYEFMEDIMLNPTRGRDAIAEFLKERKP